MKALWEQTKATTNGRIGFGAFVVWLGLLVAMDVLFFVGTVSGAMTLALVGAACALGLALLAPAVTAIAQGYRRAHDRDAVVLGRDGLWHVSAQRWEVGDAVVLDHRRCRLRSCVQRSDRPFAPPRRAVYLFTAEPPQEHVLGNVARGRARYLYQLAHPATDGKVFQRGIAIAVTGDVRATVVARHEWSD